MKTTQVTIVTNTVTEKEIFEMYRKQQVEKLKKRGFKNVTAESDNGVLTISYEK